VVSLASASLARVEATAAQYKVASLRLGRVTRSEFRIQYNGTPAVRGLIGSFRQIWAESIGKAVESA
jgi:hypothetical protein